MHKHIKSTLLISSQLEYYLYILLLGMITITLYNSSKKFAVSFFFFSTINKIVEKVKAKSFVNAFRSTRVSKAMTRCRTFWDSNVIQLPGFSIDYPDILEFFEFHKRFG